MNRRIATAVLIVAAAHAGCSGADGTGSTVVSTTQSIEESASSTPSPSVPGLDVGDIAPVPPGVGGEATGPLGSNEIRVDTDAGTVQIGSGSVPDRLGPSFPLPADFVVELASETETDLGFSGTTDESLDDLIELFETGLPTVGYPIVSIDRRGSRFAVFEFANDVGLGQVAISQAPSGDGYTVIVAFGDGDGDEAQLEN